MKKSFFGDWPRQITRKVKGGEWAWAIQNKLDGHCIYDVVVYIQPHKVQAVGVSEKEKYGHGSDEEITKVYESEVAFATEWGLK